MSDLPERSREAPQVAHLRAADADRDRVSALLAEAMTQGRLDHEEYAERLDAVHVAKTLGELERLTDDLPAPATPVGPVTRDTTATGPTVDPADASDAAEKMLGIFGGGERKGRWRVRRRTEIVAVCGGFHLDMTEAVFEAPVVEVKVFALFGGFEITVPDGVDVRSEASAVFGGVQGEGGRDVQSGSPVVVVKGFALFGGGAVHPAKN